MKKENYCKIKEIAGITKEREREREREQYYIWASSWSDYHHEVKKTNYYFSCKELGIWTLYIFLILYFLSIFSFILGEKIVANFVVKSIRDITCKTFLRSLV